jgi:hypothetical protein
MNLWMLLMGICFTASIFSGWLAGRPAGFIGILVGLFASALLGIGGVLMMAFAEMRYVPWISSKHQKVQAIAYLLIHLLGLMWCLAVGLVVYFIAKFLIHHVVG